MGSNLDYSLDPDAQYSPQVSADFLDVDVSFLAKCRRLGTGPKYIRLSANRVKYRRRDLLEYQESLLVVPEPRANSKRVA